MKMSVMILTFATLFVSEQACSEKNNSDETNTPKKSTSKINQPLNNYFPFKITDTGGQYSIIAETESKELYPKYANFFEKNGYSGNGYCWEGHITQILEELDPDLLNHITFDPEAGAFFALADSKENQLKFVEILSPIFSDFKVLEKYVKKADRDRIDD